jgi:pyridoxine 4-dehydrogenase
MAWSTSARARAWHSCRGYPLGAGMLADESGAVAEIARRHQATPVQVALAWLLQRSPAVLPIPGTSSIEHFDENRGALRLHLSAEEMAALAA